MPNLSLSLPQMERALREQGSRLAPYRVAVPAGVSGKWSVQKFTVALDLENLRYMREGRGCSPGEFTQLRHKDFGVVMSDTDAEIRDFLRYIRCMAGDILVTGLGLGCVVQALSQQNATKSVTVIENSADVLRLVAAHYCDHRVSIIEADAYKWLPPRGVRFDWAWHDVWNSPSEDDLVGMTKMKRHYQRHMVMPGRQFCWAENWLRRR